MKGNKRPIFLTRYRIGIEAVGADHKRSITEAGSNLTGF